MMKARFVLLLMVILCGCSTLPGVRQPFALGGLLFGLTGGVATAVLAGKDFNLDTNDTPLGQTWSVLQPFADREIKPSWLTAPVTRVALSFWDDRLYRVRLHMDGAGLDDMLAIKDRFARGYELEADLSAGEKLWLEYRTQQMRVFVAGGVESPAATFVDLDIYRGVDVSRQRYQKKAAAQLRIHDLRFGMSLAEAEGTLGHTLEPSDFFTGQESRKWVDAQNGIQWELGFAEPDGLASVGVVYADRWPPERVRQTVLDWTKQFGQGQMRAGGSGYTLVIDADNVRISLVVLDCNDQGCMVSEGWIWAGPSL